MPFSTFGLDAALLRAIGAQGYLAPTPVQTAAIDGFCQFDLGFVTFPVGEIGGAHERAVDAGRGDFENVVLLDRVLDVQSRGNRGRDIAAFIDANPAIRPVRHDLQNTHRTAHQTNADEFKAIYAYSPLHNLKVGTKYPSTLITTADHDDRVVPAHSFKFAATLQKAHAGSKPVLIRIETKAGHGAGKPTAKLIEEASDKWVFVAHELGMKTALP